MVIDVPEFSYLPILCKKSLEAGGKKYLEDGRLYCRPRGKVESTAKITHEDMREVMDMAVVKHHRHLQRQCRQINGGAGTPGPLDGRAPAP